MTNEATSGAANARAHDPAFAAELLVLAGTYRNATHAAFLAALHARDVSLNLHADLEDAAAALDALDQACQHARGALNLLLSWMVRNSAVERAVEGVASDGEEFFSASPSPRCGTVFAVPYLVERAPR